MSKLIIVCSVCDVVNGHSDDCYASETTKLMDRLEAQAPYEFKLEAGRRWCESHKDYPTSPYWQGYHNALADQQAKTPPWDK